MENDNIVSVLCFLCDENTSTAGGRAEGDAGLLSSDSCKGNIVWFVSISTKKEEARAHTLTQP